MSGEGRELSEEELSGTTGELLPEREAMSLIDPGLHGPQTVLPAPPDGPPQTVEAVPPEDTDPPVPE